MINKVQSTPLYIQKLEALLRRIPGQHEKRKEMEDELSRKMSGFKGELSLDYYLRLIPDKSIRIFHDIRLSDGEYTFQIDTLLMCTRFFLILGVKNFSGSLLFDRTFKQLVRKINNMEETFPDPFTQVKRQQLQLKNWLKIRKISEIPIETLVVISNPYTYIMPPENPAEVKRLVTHSANLISRISNLENKHKHDALTEKALARLSKILLKNQIPDNRSVLEKYQITKHELIKGAVCLKCSPFLMIREYGRWICTQCGAASKEAHIDALRDYLLLWGETISNQELREFLGISSASIAARMLSSLQLPYTGSTKDRRYSLAGLLNN
ncbi:nuclease-related domain-containing protein [Bacillus sp. MUM 13]|uniref:nuclease-related domain-containing protein n=1 Tax=Bacillus sp. MUM 13 TaxID=1678001 RepID=UPI0008F56DFE|nr:nuclease-related domain-containing protein [Bacillus sp. MUM 13]OIK13335.1 hypothetical protein BIV59_06145 [Bacillus sp. MUM 13]